MAHFDWHDGPVSAISWHPTDDSAIAVSSCDNTISLWDLAVEEDEERMEERMKEYEAEGIEEFPAQLLFQHQGQQDIMDCRWHPQIPGMVVSSASDGFNVFKPCKTCNF